MEQVTTGSKEDEVFAEIVCCFHLYRSLSLLPSDFETLVVVTVAPVGFLVFFMIDSIGCKRLFLE